MARFFEIKALTTAISLDADRKGQASFTVTNATNASIRGDVIVVPQAGAQALKFGVENPSRHYEPGATEEIAVTVEVPPEVPAGTYGFVLRVLLGGGVPEEEYDDGPVVTCEIQDTPPPVVVPPPPPKPVPWWVFAVAGVAALLVIGAIVFLLLRRPPTPPGPTITPAEAVNHVGTTATVCGVVAGSNWVFLERGHPTWLNMGAAYPSQPFNVVIWGEERRAWPLSGKPDVVYLGKTICVTGIIRQYNTWTQIQDASISDIHIVP